MKQNLPANFVLVAIAALATGGSFAADRSAAEALFRKQVAPIFQRRCLGCHGGSERQGGLSLQSATTTAAGGDSGAVIAPGEPDRSYLLELITPEDGRAEMPQNADPLLADEVAAIRRWIADGAAWPEGLELDPARVEATDWWSLRPLTRPPLPTLPEIPNAWVRTPIDAFVADKLIELGLSPSPEADRRTLIRRLYFDLLGLPPTPEEIEAFVADAEPDAYERLVDRLLASPHYGERWARHWLDVVHYGDTHGYDKDKLRPNAWPYRDYVIRALNDDKPYARFLLEQVAGDMLCTSPSPPWADASPADGIVATGFLAAGPWDFISHVEVPESKIDGQLARSLDRDDMVRTVLETFNSMTVGCARCHHHKFDPVTQEDYYSLQAVFAAIDRADRPYDADAETAQRRRQLEQRQRELVERKTRLDAEVQRLAGAELETIDRQIAALRPAGAAQERPEFGYHSQIAPEQNTVKWVQIDLGRAVSIDQVVLVGCHDTFNNIGAGFGFPVRYKIELSDTPEFPPEQTTILVDRTQADIANPGVLPQVFPAQGQAGRYLRVTATRLALRQNDYIFALAELHALAADGQNLAAGATVTALDSIEAPVRWQAKNLVDGYYFGVAADPQRKTRLSELGEQRQAVLTRVLSSDRKRELDELERELASVANEVRRLPPPRLVYAAATEFAPQGNFRPTQGKPREIRVLKRGQVTSPGEPVRPGALTALSHGASLFDLPPEHTEGDRRVALARWLADPANPLTWRSIVNRIWLYHFGRGIADSPNDLGRMGQLPTHPELLDWLAVEFRDGGQSWKALHRLICTSATYRQASSRTSDGGLDWQLPRPGPTDAEEIDAENRYLWRMNRRRLEAEAIRDAVLAVSGKLDSTMYGPGFQDFVIDKPEHSPHFEYQRHDPEDPACHRRAVYRFIVRSQQQPFLTTLDCADPSMQVEKRNETITPQQALALLNNQFMIAMSRHFAERVAPMAASLPGQLTAAFRLALGRSPTDAELARLVAHAERHGLVSTCRVILNLNEFVFVD